MAAIATAGLLFITYCRPLPPNSPPAGTTLLPHGHQRLPPNVKSNCRAHTVVARSGVRCHLHTSPAITGFDLSCHSTSRSQTVELASASTGLPATAPASQHLSGGTLWYVLPPAHLPGGRGLRLVRPHPFLCSFSFETTRRRALARILYRLRVIHS